MALKLYGIAASRASRPLWFLEEVGVAYEHIQTDYRKAQSRTAEFLMLNGNGHIPVLDDDGIIVWESMACSLYLARKYANHGGLQLGAQNLSEEAEVLRWTFWTVTELEKDALTVLMHRMVMPAEKRDPVLAEQAEKRLKVPLRVLETHLQSKAHLKANAYLAADRFTVADINVASVMLWLRAAQELLVQFPAVHSWLQICLARPAQQRVRSMARA